MDADTASLAASLRQLTIFQHAGGPITAKDQRGSYLRRNKPNRKPANALT